MRKYRSSWFSSPKGNSDLASFFNPIMLKRPFDESENHEEEHEMGTDLGEEITANRIRKDQSAQQKSRRTSIGGLETSTKNFLCSTLASRVMNEAHDAHFHCSVSLFEGILNKTLSNSNIRSHYRCAQPQSSSWSAKLRAKERFFGADHTVSLS